MRRFIFSALLLIAALARAADKPSVLFIMSDDLRDTLGATGSGKPSAPRAGASHNGATVSLTSTTMTLTRRRSATCPATDGHAAFIAQLKERLRSLPSWPKTK